jgi:hypothetical protein
MRKTRQIAAWQAKMDTLMREAQGTGSAGLYELSIHDSKDAPALASAAADGDVRAAKFIVLILDFLDQFRAQRHKPLCLTCDALIAEPPPTLAVLTAARDDSSVASVSGICGDCRQKYRRPRGALKAAVMQSYREFLMSDVREIEVSRQTGHA